MTAHEDPDHGKGHCHHAWSVEGCYACWNQLPNDEVRHRLSSRQVVELVSEAKSLRQWAAARRIEDIPEAFDRLSDWNAVRSARIDQLEHEVERLNALLGQAIAQKGRKK